MRTLRSKKTIALLIAVLVAAAATAVAIAAVVSQTVIVDGTNIHFRIVKTTASDFDSVFMEGPGAMSNMLVLMHRGMSIAGGTSEIKRNQIGERILGLPRDPLIK